MWWESFVSKLMYEIPVRDEVAMRYFDSSFTKAVIISVCFISLNGSVVEDSDFFKVEENGNVYLANDVSGEFPNISAAELREAFQPDEDFDAVWWNGTETPEKRKGKSVYIADPPPRQKPTCYRQCILGAPPLVCYFRFRIEEYVTMGRACGDCPRNVTACTDPHCITADGIERSVLVVNRKLPGPNIQVCKGDIVVVDVKNSMPGRSTSIHWHGIKQRGTPHMDGVSMVTQCPIPEGSIFRYRFIAKDPGTHLWYSHDGLQKMDGVMGAFVVRLPREHEPNRRYYEYDIKDHTILVTDWTHTMADSKFPGHLVRNTAQMPNTYLINGRGGFMSRRQGNSSSRPNLNVTDTHHGHHQANHNQAHHRPGSSWPHHWPHGTHHGRFHHLMQVLRPSSHQGEPAGQKTKMETYSEDLDIEDRSDTDSVLSQSINAPEEQYQAIPQQETGSMNSPTRTIESQSEDTLDPFPDIDFIDLQESLPPDLRTFGHFRFNASLNATLSERLRRFFGFDGNEPQTPYALFRVTPGMRYRFRLIGGNSAMCAFVFAIENHRMTVIAVDGDPVTALPVDSITIFPGERYDVVVEANRIPGAYWISVRGIGACLFVGAYQVAVLRYSGLGSVLPKTPQPGSMGLPTGVMLNTENTICENENERNVCIRNLHSRSLMPSRRHLLTQPNTRIILNFRLHAYTDKELFRSGTFKKYFVMPLFPATTSVMNNMSNLLPPSPIYSQLDDIPDSLFCNMGDPCRLRGVCECMHVIHIPLGSDIELILADMNPIRGAVSTSFHLHGHSFRVAAQGLLYGRTGFEVARSMALGQESIAVHPPLKDTVAVPSAGFVVLRFLATNPGYWLLNCGYIYRSITGMSVIFQVGTPREIPPAPPSFPRCGDYLPPVH